MQMRLRVFVASLMIIAAASQALAAEFWVSQDPSNKNCKIVETMPDGKTTVALGAKSYPTKDEAKAAKRVAFETGECIKN
jgi:hypothetical protein